METNDGFTFKRIKEAKKSAKSGDIQDGKRTNLPRKQTNKEARTLEMRSTDTTGFQTSVPDLNRKWGGEIYVDSADNKSNGKGMSLKLKKARNFRGKTANDKLVSNPGGDPIEFKFTTVRRRNTLIINDDLDLTTEIMDDLCVGDTGMSGGGAIKELKTEAKAVASDPSSSHSSLISNINGENTFESTLKLVVPKPVPQLKSYEIYKVVSDKDINTLLKHCIEFLKVKNEYSDKIIKYCNMRVFTDINYRMEIEKLQREHKEILCEIDKWRDVEQEVRMENGMSTNAYVFPQCVTSRNGIGDSPLTEIGNDMVNDGRLTDSSHGLVGCDSLSKQNRLEPSDDSNGQQSDRLRMVREMFATKVDQMNKLENRLNFSLNRAKVKADNLLKKVFGITGSSEIDSMFLIKALGRIGQ